MNRQLISYILVAIVLALLPAIGAYPIFVMKVMCYALFACAFNLLLGYTGLLSFGHAAFLGGAAYATGHSLAVWGMPTIVGLLFGTGVAALMGLVMGALAIRRSGIYFAMITLAMAQMVFFFFLQAPFTHGEDGLQGIPRGNIFGLDLADDLNLYYVVMVIFVAGYAICWRTVNSPFGQVLKAIRENEPRAISLGYNVDNFKLLVFVLSAALAGLAAQPRGRAGRSGRCDEGPRVRLGHLVRRDLADVRHGHTHDAHRRHGHLHRPGTGRVHRRHAGKQGG